MSADISQYHFTKDDASGEAPQRQTFILIKGISHTLRGGFARRAKRPQHTAKRCGPGSPTVASIRGACVASATATKRGSPGEYEGTVKPLRGESRCLSRLQ